MTQQNGGGNGSREKIISSDGSVTYKDTYSITNPKENWEKEYEDKFFEGGHFGGSYYSGWEETGEDIRQFIREQLALQRQQILEAVEKEKEEILSALEMMYFQYCGDGHDFMSAGESASAVLEHYGRIKVDEAGSIISIKNL